MKNLHILLWLVWLVTAIQVRAQQADTSHLVIHGRTSFGIKFGLTQSQLYGSQIDSLSADGSASAIQGFHVGVTVNSMLGNHFWLKHELLVTQRGSNITLSDPINGSYKTTLKTWSLDLFPFSPTYHYKGIQVYAGPYLSVLLDAAERRKNASGLFEDDHSIFGNGRNIQRQSKYLQKFDYGICVGIEYEFKFGVNVGAKYTRGYAELLDAANSITVGKITDPTKIAIYSEFVNVSLGYSFARGKNK
jgi:hypothetical protein